MPTKLIAGEKGMSNCRHHWSLKGVNCPYCVDELIKSKDRELATAKAENGRLLSVINEAHKVVYEVYEIVGIGQKAINGLWEVLQMLKPEGKALSSSNAFDYWQGEVRKAVRKAFEQSLLMDASEIQNEIKMIDGFGQSNQSKGEKPKAFNSGHDCKAWPGTCGCDPK